MVHIQKYIQVRILPHFFNKSWTSAAKGLPSFTFNIHHSLPLGPCKGFFLPGMLTKLDSSYT